MLLEYIKNSRFESKERFQRRIEFERKPLKQRWKDYWGRGGWAFASDTIAFIITIPFGIMYVLLLPIIIIYCLAALIAGICFYIPISLIIGVTMDFFGNVFFKKEEKWKYTDKMLNWWEFTPYGMSFQGYVDFKKNRIWESKVEKVFEDYWDSKIDRLQAEKSFEELRQPSHYPKENVVKETLGSIDAYKKLSNLFNEGGIVDAQKINTLKSEARMCLGRLR